MASRLNKRFLLILAAIIIVIAAGSGGLYVLAAYKSVDDLIRMGDEYYQQGKYKSARYYYGKAIRREKAKASNIDLLVKFYDATSQVKVPYGAKAFKSYSQMRTALSNALREAPGDPQVFQRLMDLLMRVAQEMAQISMWDDMYKSASQALEVSPRMIEARKYRGLANVYQNLAGLDLSEEERLLAREDLESYLEYEPGDTEAVFSLAQWYVAEAWHMMKEKRGTRQAQIDQLRQQAIDLTDQARKLEPQNIRRQLNHVRILMFAERKDEAKQVVKRIESRLIEKPTSRYDVLILSGAIEATSLEVGQKYTKQMKEAINGRQAELYAAAIKVFPDDLMITAAYANSLVNSNKRKEGVAIYEQIHEVDVLDTPLEAYLQSSAQRVALRRWVELLIEDAKAVYEDKAEHEKALARIDVLLEEVHTFNGASADYNMMVGRVALQRKKWNDACYYFRSANEQYSNENIGTLWFYAQALEKAGRGGAAIQALNDILAKEGMEEFEQARFRLIRLNIRHKQFEEAQRHLDIALKRDPQNMLARSLQIDLHGAQGKTKQALENLDDLDPQENPRVVLKRVHLLFKEKRDAEAIELLKQEFEENPTSERILHWLIRRSTDPEEIKTYLKKARAAGLEAKWVEALQQQVTGKMSPQEYVIWRSEQATDPFKKQQGLFSGHNILGNTEDANAALNAATEIEPDNPWVIEQTFDRALEAGQWEQAESLTRRAAMFNVDKAQGKFFLGKLQVAMKQYGRAVASFREGVNKRPLFPAGWILLADAQGSVADWAGAKESYNKVLELVPDSIRALRGIALVHITRKDHGLALEYLRQTYEYLPDSILDFQIYAQYEQTFGNANKAMELRQQWLASHPEDYKNQRLLVRLLSKMGKHQEGRQLLDKIVEEEGVTRATVMAQAQHAVDRQDFLVAKEIIDRYVETLDQEGSIEDWLVTARFLFLNKRYSSALVLYRKAITLEDPQTMPITHELVNTLLMAGMSQKALDYLAELQDKFPNNTTIAIGYAEALLNLNRADEAGQVVEHLTADGQGADDQIYLLQAKIAKAKGQFEAAHRLLDSTQALAPQLWQIYYLRAQLYRETPGKSAAALEAINHALDLDRTLISAKLLRAMLFIDTGELKQAATQLQSVLRQDDENLRVRRLLASLYQREGNFDQGRRLLVDSAQKFPDDSVWQLRLGHLALAQDNNELAAEHFQKALALEPSYLGLRDLAHALNRDRRYEQTLQALRDNVELLQKHPLLNSKRGWALAGKGQLPQAMRAFDLAIQACKNLAHLELTAQDMDKAIGIVKAMDYIEKRINPRNAVYVNLLLAAYNSAEQNFSSAIDRLQSIDPDVPQDSPYRLKLDKLLARAMHFTADYEGAYRAYLRVIERDPQAVIAMNNLAYMLCEKLARPDEALQYAVKADELSPDSVELLDTLGWVRFRLGQATEAERLLRRSTEKQKRPANCLHLALVLVEQGQRASIREAVGLAKTARDLAREQDNAQIENQSDVLLNRYDTRSRANRP